MRSTKSILVAIFIAGAVVVALLGLGCLFLFACESLIYRLSQKRILALIFKLGVTSYGSEVHFCIWSMVFGPFNFFFFSRVL